MPKMTRQEDPRGSEPPTTAGSPKPSKGLPHIKALYEAGQLEWAIDGPYPLSGGGSSV